MSQLRIVLDSELKPKAEQIMKATGIKTLSQIFTIFVVYYGDELVNSLITVQR